jgi:hypothetical protein
MPVIHQLASKFSIPARCLSAAIAAIERRERDVSDEIVQFDSVEDAFGPLLLTFDGSGVIAGLELPQDNSSYAYVPEARRRVRSARILYRVLRLGLRIVDLRVRRPPMHRA